MTAAKIAMETVYQSSSPTWPRTLKSVKNAIEKLPWASSGTPRARLPAAAPNRMARSTLAHTNTKSQNPCHRRSFVDIAERWWRGTPGLAFGNHVAHEVPLLHGHLRDPGQWFAILIE